MSKQHTPTPRNYLQIAIDRINDLIPLAKLGLQYQESNFYPTDQRHLSRESIGQAKRFVEYTSKHPEVNNHDGLVNDLTNMVAYMEEFFDVPESDMSFDQAKQLLAELKEK